MEDLSMEELRKLIVKAMKELSPDNFDFTNDFAEELCDDYWRRAEKAPDGCSRRAEKVQDGCWRAEMEGSGGWWRRAEMEGSGRIMKGAEKVK